MLDLYLFQEIGSFRIEWRVYFPKQSFYRQHAEHLNIVEAIGLHKLGSSQLVARSSQKKKGQVTDGS
jgi:hypothetical protein